MHIAMPPDAAYILETLHAAGYGAEIVGGCVRDALRGIAPHDWDLCTAATPDAVKACFPAAHIVETGLSHGTVTVILHGVPYEVTTYRTDGVYTDHRHPTGVTFTRTLADDLARRDFTINAMAYSAEHGLTDPFGGQADLAARRIRCVGEADKRFSEDALRILRALRLAAVLGFSLDADTLAAAHAQKNTLCHVSAERIESELTTLLCGAFAGDVLRAYPTILAVVLPFIPPMLGFLQNNPYHDKDVWLHTVAAVEAAAPDPVVRWALLLHDSGKPECYTEDANGVGHFYGHGSHSARIARETLAALHADMATRNSVEALVRWHDVSLAPTLSCVSRWLRRLGEPDLRRLLEIKRCDSAAHRANAAQARQAETAAFTQLLDEAIAQQACLTVRQLEIHGGDVIACGVAQGPAVGELLEQLLSEVLNGDLPNNRTALLARVKALACP